MLRRLLGLAFLPALADRGRPVLLAIDLGQHLVGQALGRAVVDDLAELQPDDALGEHLGQQDVVDVDDRRQVPLAAKLADQAHDLPRGLGVEAGGRLVDQQQPGVLDQGPGDADPLPLPARELVGPLVDHMLEADPRQQPEGLVDVALRKAPEVAAPEADVAQAAGEHVLHHRQALDQGVFLEDHAHLPAHPAQGPAAQAGDLHPVQPDLAAARLDQAVDAADQGRLAGPGRTDQGQDLALGHLQVDALQGQVPRRIALGQRLQAQQGPPPRPPASLSGSRRRRRWRRRSCGSRPSPTCGGSRRSDPPS